MTIFPFDWNVLGQGSSRYWLRSEYYYRAILLTAFIGGIVHWRVFDMVMGVGALSILLIHPKKEFFVSVGSDLKIVSILFFIWFLALGVGLSLAGIPGDVLNFRWILGFYVIFCCAKKSKFESKVELTYWSIILILLSAVAFYVDYKVTGYLPERTNRFKGFYHNPNVFGMAFSFYATYLIGWIVSDIHSRKRPEVFAILALITSLVAVFVTYSRSSWVGIAAAFVIACLIYIRNKKVAGILAVALISLAAVFQFNLYGFKERMLYTADLSMDSSSSVRLNIWKANWQMFLDHPLFGVGYWENTHLLKTYGSGIPDEDIMAHAHNQYLQVLSSSGIFSLFIYLAIVITAFVFFSRNFKNSADPTTKKIALASILVLVTYSVISFADSPMDSRESRNFFMYAIGASAGIIVSRKKLSISSKY